jgi:hypothetical protein
MKEQAQEWIFEMREAWKVHCRSCDVEIIQPQDIFYCIECKRKAYLYSAVVQQSYNMMFPISVLALLVYGYIHILGIPAKEIKVEKFSCLLYFDEQQEMNSDVGLKIIGGMINGAFILLATLVLTIVFIVAFAKNNSKIIQWSVKILYGSVSICSISYFIL